MQACVVEPAEVLDDRELELGSGLPDAIGDQLGLDRVDEALGERVIERVADRADGLQHLVVVENLAELDTGVLRSAVGVVHERDFTASRADELYVADFTYLRCWEGLVFLAFVIDVHSRRVVGWQLASHMRASLVCDALRMAVSTRRRGADVALVHHSDRGSQYTSIEFGQVLDDHQVLQSVGSVGDAYDNAMAESFVDTVKTELIADRVWRSRDQLELAIVEYLGWFNTSRLHESLGDLTPAEFETLHAARFETSTPTIKI